MKYNKEYFEERGIEDKHYRMALQWLSLLKPTNILDYGCGRGPFVHAFNYFNIPAKGFDVSDDAVSNPVGLAEGKISTVLPTDSYDTVICIDVMEHIPHSEENKVINTLIQKTKRWLLLSICDVTLKDVYVDETHINLKSRAYWEHVFTSRGMTKIEIPNKWHFKDQLYLFKKNENE